MHQLSRMSLLVPVFTAAKPRVASRLSKPKVEQPRIVVGQDVGHQVNGRGIGHATAGRQARGRGSRFARSRQQAHGAEHATVGQRSVGIGQRQQRDVGRAQRQRMAVVTAALGQLEAEVAEGG